MSNEKREIYAPYSEQWRLEMKNHTKDEIIDFFIKAKHGTSDPKIANMDSREDAMRTVGGILNDWENGIIEKSEAFGLFGEYTARLMHLFWNKAVEKIRDNPELLNEPLTPIP